MQATPTPPREPRARWGPRGSAAVGPRRSSMSFENAVAALHTARGSVSGLTLPLLMRATPTPPGEPRARWGPRGSTALGPRREIHSKICGNSRELLAFSHWHLMSTEEIVSRRYDSLRLTAKS